MKISIEDHKELSKRMVSFMDKGVRKVDNLTLHHNITDIYNSYINAGHYRERFVWDIFQASIDDSFEATLFAYLSDSYLETIITTIIDRYLEPIMSGMITAWFLGNN